MADPKLPTTIKVGPLDYTVTCDELAMAKACNDAREMRIGQTDEKLLQITLDPALPPAQMRAVLLHEALHAVTAGTTLAAIVKDTPDEDRDERIVAVLELPLLALLRDNPALVTFLTA